MTETECNDYKIMLQESRDRLRELVSAYKNECNALGDYWGQCGIEHSDEDCPEDDTCECKLVIKVNLASDKTWRAVELAERRIDKIGKALKCIND